MSIFTYLSSKFKTAETAPAMLGRFTSISSWNPDDLICRKGYAVYDEMQRDAQVQACLTIKKFSVISNGWDIHSASESGQDNEIADFVKFTLEDMRGTILDVLYNALDAIAKGYSIMEINYRIIPNGRFKGMIGISSIKSKDPADFEFDTDEFLNIKSIRQISLSKTQNLDPAKFVIYTYRPSYESPYGTSDLRAAYKHYWSKDILTRFLNLYLEKYGSPTAKGSYKRGTPKTSQEELLRVLDKIQHETAIVVPEDITVELLEAQRGGEAGYLQALEFHDKQIAKAILGQTLLTGEGMKVGSFALARVHLDVLKMCLKKIKRDLEESIMREQIIRQLVDFNYVSANYPVFSLGTLEDRDLDTVSSAICKLISGEVVSPDERWVREYLGIPEKE